MAKDKFYIGIDVGINGGIVIQGLGRFAMHKMPLRKDKQVDFVQLFKLLNYFKPNNCHVGFEKMIGMFGYSKSTVAHLAEQVGHIKGICIALKLPYTEIPPKTWQKEMFAGIEKRKKLGDDKIEFVNDTKATAYFAFIHIFPKLNAPKKPRGGLHDGLIDAALICRYIQRRKL